MVIVEFTLEKPRAGKKKDYFVGKDLQSVLDDTAGGKSFGGAAFSGYRVIDLVLASRLNLLYFDESIQDIREGHALSLLLG